MSFRDQTTLAGYARTAVDLKTRMDAYCRSAGGTQYLEMFARSRFGDVNDEELQRRLIDAIHRLALTGWRFGEPYVLAPAMTAIVAAAADALDLTGEMLTDEVAPTDTGALFLPEPIYHRDHQGHLNAISAITWARMSTDTNSAWFVGGWSDPDDPANPGAARVRANGRRDRNYRRWMGPYILGDFDHVPIGRPMPANQPAPADDGDRDWEPVPDGRYVIDAMLCKTSVCTAILYAFWAIQAQPLATVAPAPLDRNAARRAVRAAIVHDTRVVMLRRVSPIKESGDGEAKWHYRVRFVVRGHWRRLTDRNGVPYRIWIHAHIKGPDGAPLLHGEKVAVLAR